MKKQFLLGVSFFALLGGITWFAFGENGVGTFKLEDRKEEGGVAEKAQRAKEAMEWRYDKLKDEQGNFDASYYKKAIAQANQLKQSGNRAGALNLQWEELGPDNVGGRTRAILIDKRDPSHNTVYAGGVSGGMWKSLDGGNTWTKLSAWNEWLTISCIAQAPDGTIYIGTGEGLAQIGGSSLNSGSMGNGIFKLDGSDNPVLITPDGFSTNSLDNNNIWAAVNRIAINPNDGLNMAAATGKGLYMTTDGGANWTQATIPGIANGQGAADVKWASDGIGIFAAVGGVNSSKIARSQNGGFTWTRISNVNNPGFPGTQGRIEIALAPSDPSVVYIAVASGGGCTYGAFRSGDGGETWTNIGTKSPLFDPYGPNCQGWYDNVITVSPADPNKVYMGGIDLYTWSDQTGWKLADVGLGGSESNPNYIHPDKHAITIDPDNPNVMYVGCDGGIYKSTNAFSAFPFPTYVIKNRGYNVTQFYSVAAALSGEVLGGTQDNGTQYINYLGNTRQAAKRVIGGDGIYTEISHIDPHVMFGGIYFGEVLRSGNTGASFDGFYDNKIDPQSHTQPSRCGGQKDQNAPFITPFYLAETKTAANGLIKVPFIADKSYSAGDVVTAQSKVAKTPFNFQLPNALNTGDTAWADDPIRSRIFVTSNCGVWMTSDALDLGLTPKWFRLTNTISGTAVSYAASSDGDVLYIGTSGGRVYKCPHLNMSADTAVYPIANNVLGYIYSNTSQFSNSVVASGRSIEGVAVDPNDANHVVAVVAGFSASNLSHVYESKDGGQSWNALSNGLPNMPVYDVVIHDANTIIIGTELGIWSWDGTQWSEENNVLPRVPVFRLIEKNLYNSNCRVLYIGTHGRGIWRSTTLTTGGCNTVASINKVSDVSGVSGLDIYPNPVSSSSKIVLTVDKPTDVTFRVFDMTGKLFREFSFKNLAAGQNEFDLNASGLSSGTYVLAATVGNVRTQSRLFVVKN